MKMAIPNTEIRGLVQNFAITTVTVKNHRAQEIVEKNGGIIRVATKINRGKVVSRVSCPRINARDPMDGMFSDVMAKEASKIGEKDVEIILQLPIAHDQIKKLIENEEIISIFKIRIIEQGYAIKTFWTDKSTGELLFDRLMDGDAELPRTEQNDNKRIDENRKGPLTRSKASGTPQKIPEYVKNSKTIRISVQIKPSLIDQLILNDEINFTIGYIWKDGRIFTAVQKVEDSESYKEFVSIYQCENEIETIITTYILTGDFPIKDLPTVFDDKKTVRYKICKILGKPKIIDMVTIEGEQNEAFHNMNVNIRLADSMARSSEPVIRTIECKKEIPIYNIDDENDDDETSINYEEKENETSSQENDHAELQSDDNDDGGMIDPNILRGNEDALSDDEIEIIFEKHSSANNDNDMEKKDNGNNNFGKKIKEGILTDRNSMPKTQENIKGIKNDNIEGTASMPERIHVDKITNVEMSNHEESEIKIDGNGNGDKMNMNQANLKITKDNGIEIFEINMETTDDDLIIKEEEDDKDDPLEINSLDLIMEYDDIENVKFTKM